jgi:hypothetical protein
VRLASLSKALPPELVDLHRGYNRDTAGNRDTFAGHRARVTALIVEAAGQGAAGNGEAGRCALLGAGNGNDVDLLALLAKFREVHLIDLDREAIAATRDRLPPQLAARVFLHGPIDLGGGLARLSAWRKRAVTPAELGALPGQSAAEALAALPERFDVVASCCLLSQIVHTCDRVLGPHHGQLEAVACALVVAHVRVLVQLIAPGGVGLLITDTVSSETYPLEELWGTRPPLALLDELEAAQNQLSGTGPVFLRRILRTDDVVAPLVAGVRLVEPWLWRFNATLTLLAYALRVGRAG